MASLNRCQFIGNVGVTPEVKGTQDAGKIAKFRIACTERRNGRDGQTIEVTEWVPIVAWGKLADIAERYVEKGAQVFVEGRLRTREWTDQNGNKRYTTEIVADNIQLLGKPAKQTTNYSGDPF